ncbi:MAG: hypothetical protein GY772_18060, partial [bacterium]|nr:hypothetical protein [bacterium]
MTATWMQQVACVLDKDEYERIGVDGLAERMAIRLKTLQRETDEGDMKKQITEMVMKESRARKRGHLAERTEPMALTAEHLVRLPPVKTEVEEDALAEQRASEGVAEATWARAVGACAAGREEDNEEADWESAVDEAMPAAGAAETSAQRQASPESTSSSVAVSQRQVRRSTPQVTPMEVDSTPPEPAPKEKARPLAGRVRLVAAPEVLEEERVACARTVKEAEEEVREEKAKAKRQASEGVGSTAPAAGCAAAGVGGGAGCAAPPQGPAPDTSRPPPPPATAWRSPPVVVVDLEEDVRPAETKTRRWEAPPASAKDLAWERKTASTVAPATGAAGLTTVGRTSATTIPARDRSAEEAVKTRWHVLVPEPCPWVGNQGGGNLTMVARERPPLTVRGWALLWLADARRANVPYQLMPE